MQLTLNICIVYFAFIFVAKVKTILLSTMFCFGFFFFIGKFNIIKSALGMCWEFHDKLLGNCHFLQFLCTAYYIIDNIFPLKSV